MDALAITHLAIAMAGVAVALFGFNALVGRGPRGTVWIGAACLVTWSTMLPFVLRDTTDLTLSRGADLFVVVLRMCGIIGCLIGVLDVVQSRTDDDGHRASKWLLRQPLLWGAVACINFFGLLFQGAFHSPLLSRYCAGHPIELIEMTVFFVGLSALVLRFLGTIGQFPSLRADLLGCLVPVGGQTVEDCGYLLQQLDDLKGFRETYVVRRLREALEFVRRKNSAADLDQHLRHLEEVEAVRVNAAYSMVRIIIWAIPILGLLGTVIGITIAVANLNPETLEESMTKVTHGLGVAFDHTATALSLTMLLMFVKAGVERLEDSLLARVDARVAEELVGRFQTSGGNEDAGGKSIHRDADQVVVAIESLAGRQAEIWKSTIDDAHRQWADVTCAAGIAVRDSMASAVQANLDQHVEVLEASVRRHAERLADATAHHASHLDRAGQQTAERLREGLEKAAELLVEALERHGEILTTSEKSLAEENRQHLSEVEAALSTAMVQASERQENLIRQSETLLREMQVALVEAADATVRQQEQLVRQGDVLLKVVDATGQIKKLEESLTQNLSAVQKTHNFEEMAINLSAAINLLSARLGHGPLGVRPRDIAGGNAASQAA
jgi:biopolymer transport protein ExbB/TolQ